LISIYSSGFMIVWLNYTYLHWFVGFYTWIHCVFVYFLKWDFYLFCFVFFLFVIVIDWFHLYVWVESTRSLWLLKYPLNSSARICPVAALGVSREMTPLHLTQENNRNHSHLRHSFGFICSSQIFIDLLLLSFYFSMSFLIRNYARNNWQNRDIWTCLFKTIRIINLKRVMWIDYEELKSQKLGW